MTKSFRAFVFQLLLVNVSLFMMVRINAQPTHWGGKPKPYKLLIGIGWNAIDDDGRPFCQAFDAQQSWNMEAFPSRINLDKYFKHGLSLDMAASYNRYKPDKLINHTTGISGTCITLDANCKYSFYDLLNTPWYDPYISVGLGLSHRDIYAQTLSGTLNASIGMNFWIYKNLGIQLQSTAKLGFYIPPRIKQNYVQHSVGIVYKIVPQRRYASSSKRHYKWTHKSGGRFRGSRHKNS